VLPTPPVSFPSSKRIATSAFLNNKKQNTRENSRYAIIDLGFHLFWNREWECGLIGLAFLFNLFHVKYCVNEWA
jgi:hypothetical protein